MTLRWPRQWSLSARLRAGPIALLLALLAIAVAVEGGAVERRRTEALEDAVFVTLTSAALVDRFARDLEGTLKTVALTLGLSERPIDQSSLGPVLAGLLAQSQTLRSVFLTDVEGHVIAAPRDSSVGLDLSERPYIRELRDGKQSVWSGQMGGFLSGESILAHALVVRDLTGASRAYLVGAFYPEGLIEELTRQLPPDASLVLIDRSGAVIYASDPRAPTTVADAFGVRDALAGETVRVTGTATPFGEELRYGAIVPVPTTGWAVAYTRSQGALEADLRERVLFELAAIAALLALVVVASTLVARDLTRPLARLSAYARQVAQAGLKGPPPPVTGGGTEVEDLAEAMASMSAALMQQERELREAVQVRERFLSVASHELRTPLAILKASAQLIERRASREGPLMEELVQQVDRLDRLVGDLLDTARLQEGHLQLRRDDIDLVDLTRRVVARFEHSPDRTDRHTLVVNAPTAVHGSWDAARIEQVLNNLLSNALKYSPGGGTVTIEVRSTDREAELLVRDEGPGIPEEEQHLLFEPFVRRSTTTHVDGTGLGLYISLGIVRRHGGTIEVISAPDKGSTFVVRLPLHE